MISLHQIRRFLITTGLAAMLAVTIAFDFGTAESWAATSLPQLISAPQTQLASMNRVEAITKNLEGKAQEAIGNVTGDPKDQMMGKAKQVESQARHAAEDVKDKSQETAKSVTKTAKSVAKAVEDKAKAVRSK
jgi:uncharacterized protein YjbJ (UPF0337 family)